MDIGQALAMMRYAKELEDYQRNFGQQPTLDWRDITQPGMGPETGTAGPSVANFIPGSESASPFSYQDIVAGYPSEPTPPIAATPLPPEMYMPMEGVPPQMADLSFQELYGPAPTEPSSEFQLSPYAPSGVSGGYGSYMQPQEMAMRMPPLPIRGMPSQPEPQATVESRPPQFPSDIPTVEPIEAGRPIALGGEDVKQTAPVVQSEVIPAPSQQPVAPSQQPAAKPEEQWQPGKEFEVELNGKKAVIENFVPGAPGTTSYAKARYPQFNNRVVTYSPNSPEYKQILDKYSSMVPKQNPEDIYNSKVRIMIPDQEGNMVPTWAPARIDQQTNRIVYKDPQLDTEVVYNEKPLTNVTEEDFQGSVDPVRGTYDYTELKKAQDKYAKVLQPKIDTLGQISTGYKANDPPATIKANLLGTLSEGTADDPVGTITWQYKTPNGVISIEEAANQGYVPQDLPGKLTDSENNIRSIGQQMTSSASAAQTAKAQDLAERDLQQADRGIAALQQAIADAPNDPALQKDPKKLNKRLAELQKRLDALNKKKLDIATKIGSSQKIVGGGTVYQSTPDVTAFTINPNTPLGFMTLAAGGNAVPNPQMPAQAVQPFTPEQIVNMVAETAVEKTNPYVISNDLTYQRAISALSSRLNSIQDSIAGAAKESGRDPSDYTKTNAEFLHLNDVGQYVTTSMPIEKALDDFEAAAVAYKIAAASGDAEEASKAKQRLSNAARVFSGGIFVPGVGAFRPSALESYLSNLENAFASPNVVDLSLTRDIIATPATRVAEAAKETVIAPPPPRGGNVNTPPPPSLYAYPIYLTPGNKPIKADTGFNIFDQISRDQQSYDKSHSDFTRNNSVRTSASNIARAMFDDSGSNGVLQQAELAASNDAIAKFNQAIIADTQEGLEARAAYARTLHSLIQATGHQSGDSNVVAVALDNVYKAAKSGGDVNRAIQNVLDMAQVNDSRDAVTIQALYQSVPGYQSGQLAQQNASYKSTNPQWQTQLLENIKEAWYELGLLYAAAGKGYTAYRVGATPVTWLYNPADPIAGNQFRSGLTMPTSVKGGPSKMLAFDKTKDKNAIESGTDPAYAQVITNATNIFSSNYKPIRDVMGKSTPEVIKAAKARYDVMARGSQGGQANLGAASPTFRSGDTNTPWHSTTPEGINKLFVDSVVLGNVFGKNPERGAYAGNRWMPFSESNAIK